MTFPKTFEAWLKVVIWLCLAVIIFSPLYLSGKLFFPFIVTKTVAFNIAAEVMFFAFLLLAAKNSEYRLKLNWTVLLFAGYLVAIFISSLVGDSFYRSFWSNNERSEGIFLLINLFLFLLTLIGFFKNIKDWLKIFDIFFAASVLVALVALGQYLGVDWLLKSSGDVRLAGTIGNAGYMAGYLIFSFYLGWLLLFYRQNWYLRAYYLAGIALFVFVAVNTQTRGGILALIVTGLAFVAFLAFWFFQRGSWPRRLALIALIIFVLLGGIVYLNRNSAFVKSNILLNRVVSINTKSNTSENRLWTWGSAWQGFKERPVLGWGYENFYQPFDKYFNPKIYRRAYSVVWFDRAHNIIFDRLITGGLVGLVLYLSFLFLPLWFFWRYFFDKNKESRQTFFIPTILSLIIVAYFIQNLFIFEALAIYIPLFLCLAFVSLFTPSFKPKFLEQGNFKVGAAVVYVVIFLLMLFGGNIKPLQANLKMTKVLSQGGLSIEQRMALIDEVLAMNTLGDQEYRRQYYTLFEQYLSAGNIDNQAALKVAKDLQEKMADQLAENPYSVANYMVAMRVNNFVFLLTGQPAELERSIDFYEKALPLSPTRPQLYYEGGYAYLYLGDYHTQAGNSASALSSYELGVAQFEKAVSLNPKNFESYRQLAAALIRAGKIDRLKELFTDYEVLQSQVAGGFDAAEFFTQALSTSVSVKQYDCALFFAQQLVAIDANNPQYYIQLAFAQAYLGNDTAAISTAQKVISMDANYRQEAEDFISKVRAGEFK